MTNNNNGIQWLIAAVSLAFLFPLVSAGELCAGLLWIAFISCSRESKCLIQCQNFLQILYTKLFILIRKIDKQNVLAE
jgi:hypothetical protein